MAYDSECLWLAEHFLPGGATTAKEALAQHIQSAVEDWMGATMCDDAKVAGTVDLSQEELAKLGREHPKWWDINPSTGVARHLSR